MSDFTDLSPRNTRSTHAGVDRKVPRAASRATPGFYFAGESQRGCQSGGSRAGQLRFEKRSEYDDRTSGTELA
jgi:hypothetical protein